MESATQPPAMPLPGGTLEVRRHARKGRSLHTTRLVKGGEVVLEEAPVLLLVAPDMSTNTCATCLRAVGPQECVGCSSCQQACFCSPECLQAGTSTPWVHSPPLCGAYARLAALQLPVEEAGQLRFLLHALALKHTQSPEAAQRYAALLDLVGEPTAADQALAARLAPVLAEALAGALPGGAAALDLSELAALLRKEQLNSYGILASAAQAEAVRAAEAAARQGGASGSGRGGAVEQEEEEDGERRLRGSAIYAQASLINHECLPNVARYDFFDDPSHRNPAPASASASTSGAPAIAVAPTAGGLASTHVVFRALHDLPPGTELAQSYVPLHWGLAERQAQCRDVYGFGCTCPRCQCESQWSDEEGEESEWETDSGDGGMGEEEVAGDDAGSGEACNGEVEMEEAIGPIMAPPGEEGPLEPAYLRLFLLKYMCPRPGCFGTAAPPAQGSSLLECNVCGHRRSEQEFLRELERAQREERRAAAAAATGGKGKAAGQRR
ncbi:hypothetical protein HYH03_006800 [Edaphochlamys debaryana]|uniref:SET domain-containing protein n=1 Tax=Edaphochlamys debaryana TaxID=47281 RepID=A0A835Y4W1_9CHLO|nr:hypothetical protein HYH03_006800 [Edaphochlamys debaryana]|eukprot:KAG2495194.1 hypothetical protein HYH03_006800 [Edaphochlamys debaryana]